MISCAQIDRGQAKASINVYFKRMQIFAKHPKISSRCRFMLRDLLDLRSARWQPRRETEKAMKIDVQTAQPTLSTLSPSHSHHYLHPTRSPPLVTLGSIASSPSRSHSTNNAIAIVDSISITIVASSLQELHEKAAREKKKNESRAGGGILRRHDSRAGRPPKPRQSMAPKGSAIVVDTITVTINLTTTITI